MDSAAFDARYTTSADPWAYNSSPYERAKYSATLAACGPGPFSNALELGGSIGTFSAQLAPRCHRLTTVDFSSVAVGRARRALSSHPHAEAVVAEIPWELPARSFDLVLASEVLYYLSPVAFAATLTWLRAEGMPEGGRLVAVHWRPAGPERPFTAQQIHDELAAQPWLRMTADHSADQYLLHTWERP